MFKDQSLIPAEAMRLAALGFLAEGPMSYGALAAKVRHLTARIAGPSLDLIAAPLQLLRFEGLVSGGSDSDVDAELALTVDGLKEFERLMQAAVRAPVNDIGKLVIALKLRFLPLLSKDTQALQADLLAELAERELSRLEDLRHTGDVGGTPLADWLDLEIVQTRTRLAWFEGIRDR